VLNDPKKPYANIVGGGPKKFHAASETDGVNISPTEEKGEFRKGAKTKERQKK